MAAKTEPVRTLGALARGWIRFALLACTGLVLVALYRRELTEIVSKQLPGFDLVYLAASLTLSIALFISALSISRRDPTLDLTVAAEVLVAFGIFSMFVGLLFALLLILQADLSGGVSQPALLWKLAQPFVESIGAAGIGPILATALRFQDSGAAAIGDETSATGSVEIDEAARKVLTELEAVAAGLRALSSEVERQKIALASGMGGIAKEVSEQEKAISSAAGATKAAIERFAQAMSGGVSGIESAASSGAETLRGFAAATESAKSSAETLHRELEALGASSQKAKALLDALSEFVASLENFDLSRKT